MIEERLIHRTAASGLVIVKLVTLGPIFAVVECWPDESGWKFFKASEWAEAVFCYKDIVERERWEEEKWEQEREDWRQEYDKGPQ